MRKSFKTYHEQCTSSTSNTFRSVLRHQEISNPLAWQVESASRGEPNADALYGPGGYEYIILRVESQELSIRNRISEDMAPSEYGESSDSYVILMMAQVIGSEARDAPRGQRSHMLHEHQVLLQSQEKRKSSWKVRCTRSYSHTFKLSKIVE